MFEIDSKPEISRVEIANGNFCLVVDNFLRDPQEAVTYARAKAEDFELQESGYPGMLLLADASKLADIYSFVRRNLSREMGFCRGGIFDILLNGHVVARGVELGAAQLPH
jgi:hypothetical protein